MKKIIMLNLMALVLCSCSTNVKRLNTDTVTDLSGKWNDTDSKVVSEEMINDISNQSFIENKLKNSGKKPTIIVGNIRNLTSEHIQTGTFVKDLEKYLTNSGQFRLVANPYERDQLRSERLDQKQWSRPETQKKLKAETGADYILIGSIKKIFDNEGRTTIKFYQVNLELIDLESNEKNWIGSKKIKKQVKKPFLRW